MRFAEPVKFLFLPEMGLLGSQICVHGPYLKRIDNLYFVCKMFKNISPDLVRSGRTCPANLGVRSGQETHMPSPVESYLKKLCIYENCKCSPTKNLIQLC